MKDSSLDKKYNIIHTHKSSLGRFEIILDIIQDNGLHPYSYIKQNNSVAILALFGDKVVFIRQYRHSIKRYLLEIPGGGIEPGENPEQAAKRELLEETGYECMSLKFLGQYYPSPGSSNEKTYLFYAECCNVRSNNREVLEYMETVLLSKEEIDDLIFKGCIEHSMSLIAWMLYKKGVG